MAKVKFVDRSGEVKEDFIEQTLLGLEAVGMTAEGHGKKTITKAGAVDTGRLRASITHAIKGTDVYIGTNVKYAPGINDGTHRKAGAVHFIEDSAANHTPEYQKILKDAMING